MGMEVPARGAEGATLNVIVMAAGRGTRMKSARPKVLQRLAGRSLLQHVLEAAAALAADRTVVLSGFGAGLVEAEVAARGDGGRLVALRQEPQLGTGHAVQVALPALDAAATTTLVLNGDVPLVRGETMRALVQAARGGASPGGRLALLSVRLADPTGYGRIVRGEAGRVLGIVEHKDASEEQRRIREVYTGLLAAPTGWLAGAVSRLSNHNAQREYYLTDIVAMAVAEGLEVTATEVEDEAEVLGVNSPAQLADLERRVQRRHAEALLEQGVRLADPARFDQRGTLACGRDVEIDVNCVFEGEVVLGDEARVGANCVLRDVHVEAGAVIHPFSHLEGARVGAGALVGPFARLRPGAELGPQVHIGNFVEVKNSRLQAGAKANHLAYLGDADVGARVNYGAGSITANYDGANKHRTVLGADVHVGSNCVLVAPVVIGAGATVGGGSTITEDVPAEALAVARQRQRVIEGWQRPKKVGKPSA
jgi:bifunctional UDP-N-acetylglucosamine pyrophosphorylase/glucosamine-1-phosphate N-acetyltransferase